MTNKLDSEEVINGLETLLALTTDVIDNVNRIADEYVANGEKAAVAMLNDLMLTNNLKKWEAYALESKVCKELTKRGVFTNV